MTEPDDAALQSGVPSDLLRVSGARREQLFPTLTRQQIQRITTQGEVHQFQRGEVLVEAGPDRPDSVFLLKAVGSWCQCRD